MERPFPQSTRRPTCSTARFTTSPARGTAPRSVSTWTVKSSLKLKDNADDTKDAVGWKWKGDAVDPQDLDNPVSGSTAYTLCVYDYEGGVPEFALRADVAAGGMCGTKPCWTGGDGAFTYSDKSAAASYGAPAAKNLADQFKDKSD